MLILEIVQFSYHMDVYDDILESSCSLTFQNNLFVFGGANHLEKQVRKLVGFRLVTFSSLEFNFKLGACTNVGNEFVYLCFHSGNDNEKRLCRYAKKPDGFFAETDNSIHTHLANSIAAIDCKLLLIIWSIVLPASIDSIL